MKFRNVISATVAAGMLIAPVAAQAGTSAAASVPGVASRLSTGVSKDQKVTPAVLLLAALAIGGVAAGIAAASNGKSSGAN